MPKAIWKHPDHFLSNKDLDSLIFRLSLIWPTKLLAMFVTLVSCCYEPTTPAYFSSFIAFGGWSFCGSTYMIITYKSKRGEKSCLDVILQWMSNSKATGCDNSETYVNCVELTYIIMSTKKIICISSACIIHTLCYIATSLKIKQHYVCYNRSFFLCNIHNISFSY